MTNAHRAIVSIRSLMARHPVAVPTDELRVFLAEIIVEIEAEPVREIETLGERTTLERNPYGFLPERK